MAGDAGSSNVATRGPAKPKAVLPPDLVHYSLSAADEYGVTVTEGGWVRVTRERRRPHAGRFRLTAGELQELLALMREVRLGGHAFVDSPDGLRHFVAFVSAVPPKVERVVRDGEVYLRYTGGSGTRQASFSPVSEDPHQRPATDGERRLIAFLRSLAARPRCTRSRG